MNRFQYYIGKKVLGPDVNQLQGHIDAAIRRVLGDRGIFGIVSGAGYTITPGTGFTLSLNSGIGSPLKGYTRDGSMVEVSSNPYVTDDLSPQFSLPSAGNEKWLTIYLKHLVVESQPEREKITFLIVNFRQTESFEIVVDSGVEAPVGTAVKPTISGLGDRLYLCDVRIISTSTDFSSPAPVKDAARLEVDPVAEVSERVLVAGDSFGTEAKLALIGGLSALRFRDVLGSSTDLEGALLAALAAGATAIDRLALLSEVAAAGYAETRYFNSYNIIGVASANVINTVIPANCRLIKGRITDTSNVSSLFIYFTIDVLTGLIDYRSTQMVGAVGVHASMHAQNAPIVTPVYFGGTIFDASSINLTNYGGAGSALTVTVGVNGINYHHGSADVEFIS